MKGVCHDCNILSDNGDYTCIAQMLLCHFIERKSLLKNRIITLNQYSFLPVSNYFHKISFRGCGRSIYGVTLAEILYAVLLGFQ